jgi:undecaprenyl-diphosphatase
MAKNTHTHDVFPTVIQQIDTFLLLLINPNLVNPILTSFFELITNLGSIYVALAFCIFYYFRGNRKKALLILVAFIFGNALIFSLKVLIIRPRPYSTLSVITVLKQEVGSSFPSGHTERVFSLATLLSKTQRVNHSDRKTPFFYFLAAIVAFSRLYLGVHYPFDIFIGGFLGWIVGYATFKWQKEIFVKISHIIPEKIFFQ